AHSGGAAGRAAPVIPPTERRGPLESVLVLRRIDPWSAFTTVLGLMFALYIVWMVAIGVTYLLLSGMGVSDRLGRLLSGVAGAHSPSAGCRAPPPSRRSSATSRLGAPAAPSRPPSAPDTAEHRARSPRFGRGRGRRVDCRIGTRAYSAGG